MKNINEKLIKSCLPKDELKELFKNRDLDRYQFHQYCEDIVDNCVKITGEELGLYLGRYLEKEANLYSSNNIIYSTDLEDYLDDIYADFDSYGNDDNSIVINEKYIDYIGNAEFYEVDYFGEKSYPEIEYYIKDYKYDKYIKLIDYYEPEFYYQNLTNGFQENKKAIKILQDLGYSNKEIYEFDNLDEIDIVEAVTSGRFYIEDNKIKREDD